MNPRFTITNAMTQGLARIERVRGFLEAAQLSEGWIRVMNGRQAVALRHILQQGELTIGSINEDAEP